MEILLFIERNVLMTDTKKVAQDEQFYAESSSDGKKYNSRGKEPYKHQHGMKWKISNENVCNFVLKPKVKVSLVCFTFSSNDL